MAKKKLSKKQLKQINAQRDSWSLHHNFICDVSEILVSEESLKNRIERIQNKLWTFKYEQGELSAKN